MADHAVDDNDGDNNVFIYRGGRAPQHITHALIDRSLDEIEDYAFNRCQNLLTVETHDGLRKIGRFAFGNCRSLRRINIKSIVEIDESAFHNCALNSVEFGDRLEKIGGAAFSVCSSLTNLKLPFITTIGDYAFTTCASLIGIEFSERLEKIGGGAFWDCKRLQRIAVPLRRDLFEFSAALRKYNQFDDCEQLTTVDLIGGIDKTVASLHMESWTTEMVTEIDRINQVLPNTPADDKTDAIRQWIDSVIDKLDHYKAEHRSNVKEGITLLELALWKARLDEREDDAVEGKTKKAKVDTVLQGRRDR